MIKQGTIVLVPFPFTDLSGNKVRPALVLNSKQNGDDVLVCFISSILRSKVGKYEFIIRIENKDFKKTGLKQTSIVKVCKLATLDKKVILGELGILDFTSMNFVKKILKDYVGL